MAGGSAFVYGISVGSALSLRTAATLGATMVPWLLRERCKYQCYCWSARKAQPTNTAVDELVKFLPHVELVATSGTGFETTDELINNLVQFFSQQRLISTIRG